MNRELLEKSDGDEGGAEAASTRWRSVLTSAETSRALSTASSEIVAAPSTKHQHVSEANRVERLNSSFVCRSTILWRNPSPRPCS